MHLLLSQEHSNVLKFAQCDMIMIYADSRNYWKTGKACPFFQVNTTKPFPHS